MLLFRIVVVAAFAAARPGLSQTTAPQPQPSKPYFIVGADVSFLRNMEAKGVVFKDDEVARPGLEILRNHGYNWIRLRIMNEPTPLPNTLSYTLAEAKAAKALGFRLLLDFHYSDNWADPAHESTPKAWANLSHDQLVQAVFAFSRDTVTAFREQGTMPDMVQVGNEITSGMLWPDGNVPERWKQFAELVTAGVRGAEAGKGSEVRPAIMIHIDQGGNAEATQWFFDRLIANHVPFDLIGQSYYPWWQGSLGALRQNLVFMTNRYKKPIILAETAYDWRAGEDFKGAKREFPETPEGQRDFLVALTDVLRQTPGGLCKGFFWWEPMAEGQIAKRGMFDENHNALPVVKVFDIHE